MSQAFAVVIEETDHNFSAYVPDLPGKSSFMPA
jgi:predicted RNase H-like HicB family nuclease